VEPRSDDEGESGEGRWEQLLWVEFHAEFVSKPTYYGMGPNKGTVNLLKLSGSMGMVGSAVGLRGWVRPRWRCR
jgi:hypothetical protein